MISPRSMRVMNALARRKPDRVPRGDLAIEEGLLRRLIGEETFQRLNGPARLLEGWRQLDADLINVHDYPMDRVGESSEGHPVFRGVFGEEHVVSPRGALLTRPALENPAEARQWCCPGPGTCRTGLLDWYRPRWDGALFAQIGGPVSTLDWMLGTERFMTATATDPEETSLLAEKVSSYEIARAKIFLDHGADAILMADDIAYQRGPFLSPRTMDRIAWPIYRRMLREIKAHRNVPVLLHTDGNIRDLLDGIVESGFDGLHSLQPSADMDIHEVKERYGDRLCLMGNLDLNRLMPFGTPEEVSAEVRHLCDTIGLDGGFILATCNILTDALPVENVKTMYDSGKGSNHECD